MIFPARLLFSIVFVLLSVAVQAQSTPSACKPDAQKFCSGVDRGEGRLMTCLLEHEKDVSAPCAKAIAQVRANRPGADACSGDTAKFCKGVQPGDGRIVNCLKSHRSELSQGCGAVMDRNTGVSGQK